MKELTEKILIYLTMRSRLQGQILSLRLELNYPEKNTFLFMGKSERIQVIQGKVNAQGKINYRLRVLINELHQQSAAHLTDTPWR